MLFKAARSNKHCLWKVAERRSGDYRVVVISKREPNNGKLVFQSILSDRDSALDTAEKEAYYYSDVRTDE